MSKKILSPAQFCQIFINYPQIPLLNTKMYEFLIYTTNLLVMLLFN